MTYSLERSKQYLLRSKKVMPQGVTSNFRYLGENDTIVASHGKGGLLWDIDGNQYVDFKMGFGPIILGHADPRVNAAVAKAIEKGNAYAMNNESEMALAEKIVRHLPAIDKVRFCNSGTEATMHAIRTARGFTGKMVVAKFEGCYHGMHDYLLYSTSNPVDRLGPRKNPDPRQSSLGIPNDINELIMTLPFNNFEVMDRQLRYWSEEIGAVIVEPMMGNCAGILPQKGWLKALRDICTELGIVLIFDEVKTGFRMGLGGAQKEWNITPDLTCLAKSMGNGFPVAAYGGSSEIMDSVAYGQVAHGGTYCGNRVAMAAGIATIESMEAEPVHQHIDKLGRALMKGLKEVFSKHDLKAQVLGVPSMVGFVFTDEKVTDYRTCMTGDLDLYEKLARRMLAKGYLYEDDFREPLFLCSSHTMDHISGYLEALDQSISEIRS